MNHLTGKIALVTGAAGEFGLGRSIALKLAKDGADVVVNDVVEKPYDLDTSEWRGLQDVVHEIKSLGKRSLGLVTDITNSDEVAAMIEKIVSEFGKIDILVNNAGAKPGKDRVFTVDLDEKEWDRVITVNAKGTFLCSQAVSRHFIERKIQGKIINISSVAGKEAMPRYAAYSASKFAIIGFTQALALELAPYQINVNAVCPSLVDTERVTQLVNVLAENNEQFKDKYEELIQNRSGLVPLGRLATRTDVANTVSFLASEQSNFLTGLSIPVAGGAMLY
ncbi:SDR family oxidoreductase [Candidatus Poribacteria bacterium]|nr:SDR family oxidoreductase [Candidatus Poribacteria bacterium]